MAREEGGGGAAVLSLSPPITYSPVDVGKPSLKSCSETGPKLTFLSHQKFQNILDLV